MDYIQMYLICKMKEKNTKKQKHVPVFNNCYVYCVSKTFHVMCVLKNHYILINNAHNSIWNLSTFHSKHCNLEIRNPNLFMHIFNAHNLKWVTARFRCSPLFAQLK